MHKRIVVPLALLALAAPMLTACGGGESDEDKIVETIEQSATTTDPSHCTELQTQRYDEQNSQQQGKTAVKTCEREQEAGGEQAEGAIVSNVSAGGGKATADVRFEGGPLGEQALEFALVEEDGDWKLDQIEGFTSYDGRALAEMFEKQFEERPEGLNSAQARCIAAKVAEASQAEAEELFFGGSSEPIIELAQGCA